MAALTPTEVVVMSKHSLGGIEGHDVSHAQMGEKWLDRHLESKGKKKADFAKRLWDENITAVAEVRSNSPPLSPKLTTHPRSSATTTSKNTSFPTPKSKPGCTYTGSTRTRVPSRLTPPPPSTRSQKNGGSSKPLSSHSNPQRK